MSGRASTATERLAREVSNLSPDDLPPPVWTVARQCVFDLLGVMVAGASASAPCIVVDVVGEESPDGPATVVWHGRSVGVQGAALANAVAAHVLDFDDVLPVMAGHPSAPVVPAALALAEAQGVGGRELLTAVVAGIETSARIGAALAPQHYAQGFHTTGTVGTLGAAAACSRLLHLDGERTEMALGLAVAQASGLKCMFGTMAKNFQAGRATSSGVLAAQLAMAGFTSCSDALGADQGFGVVYAGDVDESILVAPFGEPWYVLGTLFKVHAACYYAHATIESMLFIRQVLDAPADESVQAVELSVNPVQMTVCGVFEPATPLEAKFSLRFLSALSLARGHVDEGDFTEESPSEPSLVSLRDRVTVAVDPRLSPLSCRAVVRMTDGRVMAVQRDGDPRRWKCDPAEQWDHLRRKSASLIDPVLGSGRSRQIAEAVELLEDDGSVAELLALLCRPIGMSSGEDVKTPEADNIRVRAQ